MCTQAVVTQWKKVAFPAFCSGPTQCLAGYSCTALHQPHNTTPLSPVIVETNWDIRQYLTQSQRLRLAKILIGMLMLELSMEAVGLDW